MINIKRLWSLTRWQKPNLVFAFHFFAQLWNPKMEVWHLMQHLFSHNYIVSCRVIFCNSVFAILSCISNTVFPRIVSAETILLWIWPYVLWPLNTVHKSAETIQGRKLFKGGNYSRKYGKYIYQVDFFFLLWPFKYASLSPLIR